jgi:hypothetical protein
MSQQVKDTKTIVDHMKAEPQKEHQWLQKLVGDWTYETEAPDESGQTAKSTGTETVRSIGGLWVQAEGNGNMPNGKPATTLMTLGYDLQKRRFVGSWIGSMMAYLWVYTGELDGAERVLTLSSEGPSMAGDGTISQYQDAIELTSNDQRTLTARVRTADGKWQEIMKVEYRRMT